MSALSILTVEVDGWIVKLEKKIAGGKKS